MPTKDIAYWAAVTIMARQEVPGQPDRRQRELQAALKEHLVKRGHDAVGIEDDVADLWLQFEEEMRHQC